MICTPLKGWSTTQPIPYSLHLQTMNYEFRVQSSLWTTPNSIPNPLPLEATKEYVAFRIQFHVASSGPRTASEEINFPNGLNFKAIAEFHKLLFTAGMITKLIKSREKLVCLSCAIGVIDRFSSLRLRLEGRQFQTLIGGKVGGGLDGLVRDLVVRGFIHVSGWLWTAP